MKTLLALLLLIPNLSWGNKLMPLEEYLLKHNPEDPAVLEYFEYRCASVWSAVGKLMIEQEPDVALQYQTNAGELIVRLIPKYMKNNNTDQSLATETVLNSIINIANLYMDEMNLNSQWVYGDRKPRNSRKGYTNQGSMMPGIGFRRR